MGSFIIDHIRIRLSTASIVVVAVLGCFSLANAEDAVPPKEKKSAFKFIAKYENIERKPEQGVAESLDGKWAVKVDSEGLQVNELNSGKPVFPKLKPPALKSRPMGITTWKFSPDGRILAIGIGYPYGPREERTGGVSVWDMQTGKLIDSKLGGRDGGVYIGYVYRIRWQENNQLLVECEAESGK